MRTLLLFALVFLVAIPAWPRGAVAQAARAMGGAAVGAAGGAVITLSIVVARARWQGEYLDSADDLLHWQSAPMLITPAVGLLFGLAGRDPFVASVVGSTGGMAVGSAVGAGLGWAFGGGSQEWPWAGAVIGAGAGMTIGGVALGIRAWRQGRDTEEGDPPPPVRIGVRIPL